MSKKLLGLQISAVAMMVFSIGCDPLLSQNAKDSFWAKKFPKQLEWIRSQMREIPSAEQAKIVARIKNDQNRKDLLKVAVIDSGVDVAHKDLINQIAYRIEDNRIVGAGYDIMGDGKFASHVLVDTSLFAFGASEIRDGRIVNPPESPLKVLEQMNNRFRDIIMEGIQADPELKASLFNKLSRESFTMLGFRYEKEYTESILKGYEELKKKGGLINAETVPEPLSSFRSLEMTRVVQEEWTSMISQEHKPGALKYLSYIEHGDRVLKLINQAYATIDYEYGFTKNVQQYSDFKNKLQGKEEPRLDKLQYPEALRKAMEFVVIGYDMYDPVSNLERVFKSQRGFKDLSFADAFRKYHAETLANLNELLQSPKLDKKERQKLEKSKSQMDVFANLIENLIQLEKNPAAYNKMRSDLRRYVYRTKHPYLAEKSNENSHATHVAGVIAKQHPNIRIIPIRVTTQGIYLGKDHTKEIVESLVSEIKLFMESPYYQPLKAAIAKEYGNMNVSDATILRELKKSMMQAPLNTLFIQDVLKAVEAAGKEQVKLANVSLGTTFQKNHSLSKKKESMMEDIFSEFARFKIGQTIAEKAPGTLFMIATGNDGGWIDGISKSAFPVGITSMRLMKITKELGLKPSPNNSTKNVLAVASINPNGTLTPFTNILLDPNIPQIFSTGEEIKSSVPAKSMVAADIAVSKTFQPVMKLLVNIGMANMKVKEDLPFEEQMANWDRESIDTKMPLLIREGLGTLIHIQNPVGRENMSGTSMATPTVTGVLARYLAEKMKRENISSDQIYDHPAFTPEQIIKDVMEMSKTNTISSMLTVKMLVDGIKTYEESANISAQKKAIKNFVKPRCEGVFAM